LAVGAVGEDAHDGHGLGDAAHVDRAERLEAESRTSADRVGRRPGTEDLARPGEVDDAGREIHVAADDVVAAAARRTPVHSHPHPQRDVDAGAVALGCVSRVVDGVEVVLETQARAERVVRVVEPEQQPVAQLLHDPGGFGKRGRTMCSCRSRSARPRRRRAGRSGR